MIDHLRVRRFKCLFDVEVDLAPFTVLVGPNDSGKSSLLDAIRFLSLTTERPVLSQSSTHYADSYRPLLEEWRGCWWQGKVDQPMQWEVRGRTETESFDYQLDLALAPVQVDDRLRIGETAHFDTSKRRVTGQTADATALQFQASILWDRESAPVARAIRSTPKYCLFPIDMRQPARLEPSPVLSPTGHNLAAVLDALVTGPRSDARAEIELALRAHVPTLAALALRTQNGADKQGPVKALEFVLAGSTPPVTIPAAHASDGALLLTAFLALAYGDTPEILLVEEPENGLHPSRLKVVVDLLRRIAAGEVGHRRRQVIITTHSPILLNFARPEEVRIVKRNGEGATEIHPLLGAPDVDKLLQEFAVGELWYLLGEEAILRGGPR
jgi:predicted ATPase